MGENIGACARAMQNFGLDDLRLVTPRDGWPNRDAVDVARNAKVILDNVKVFSSVKKAVADIHKLYATTARPRFMVKDTITPDICGANLRSYSASGHKCGVMFGPERTGMSNDDIILADSIVTIPVSDENTSLNLAQAASVICYEWFAGGHNRKVEKSAAAETDMAEKAEISLFLETLESELDKKGYFKQPDIKQKMVRNLNNIFTRTNLTSQEVRSLRGVVRYLVGKFD